MAKSLDSTITSIQSTITLECSKGPVQSSQDLQERIQLRDGLYSELQRLEDTLQTLRRGIQSLPTLPPEREVLWAQSVLALPNLALMEIDTTDISPDGEIVRVVLLDRTGALLEDLLIKPKRPLSPKVSNINGLRNEDLEHAPSLLNIWPRIEQSLQGWYIVSFAQTFDRNKLNEAALREHLPRMNFIGEDLQAHLGHYLGDNYIKLADACARIGHPPPERPHQTGIDRAIGQLHALQAMANAVTSGNTSSSETRNQGSSSGDHPF